MRTGLMNYIYVASPNLGGEGDAPVPDATGALPDVGYTGEDGSNTWAISGKKTVSGKTMLLQNPHLGWDVNYFTYYEAHLVAPDFELYGATQIGLPVIRFAFNQQMGISNTVNGMVGSTTYKLTLKDGGYVYDGKVMPFEVATTTYKLRQADGSVADKPLEIKSTVHGPVFTRKDGVAVALRVAGLDRPAMLHQYFDMVTAKNYDAFTAAMKRLQVPTFNISYADKDGNVEYIFNGIAPKRKQGDIAFWRGLVPGDSSDYLWTEVHPYEDLPRVTNPPAGFIQNTNDPPWFPSWPTPIKASDYPPYLAPRGPESMRSQNALSMMADNDKLTLEKLIALKLSTRSLLADRTLPDLIAAAQADTNADMQAAVKLLSEWDHIYSKDNRAGLLFEEWAKLFAGNGFGGQANYAVPFDGAKATSTPTGIKDKAAGVKMLRQAIVETKKKYGALDRVFGEVSRFKLGDVDVPGDGHVGGLGPFRVITWGALDAAGKRYPAARGNLDGHDRVHHAREGLWPHELRQLAPEGHHASQRPARAPVETRIPRAVADASADRGPCVGEDGAKAMTRRTILAVAAPFTLGAALVAQTAAPPFTPVQADLLAVPNSYSNAWGDYDNDGDLDLAVSLGTGEVRLYRNDAGVLVSVGAQVGMPQAGSHELRGLSWGDFDGDGDIDLLGGSTPTDKLTVVLRNDGGKKFVDVAAEIGLTIPKRSARQTNWVDYDNDGDLDVYSADRAGDNKLFQNTGGKFTQVFVGVGPTDPRPTVGACWLDSDNDGDLDLFLANQAGVADALWRNDGTSFTDVAKQAGVAGPPRTKAEGGVGCAVGDYDNDGRLDIFVPNYGHNQLYRNNGDGTFTDVAPKVGLAVENHAVGSDWGDYDNDGDLDLSVISYVGEPGAQTPLNALFRNDGAAGFVNVLTKDSPLNKADHASQFVDYDNDGGIDLSITDGYGPQGGHFVFKNTSSPEAKARSLSVLVLDAKGHHTRFGAEVRVYDQSGRLLATRQVLTGGGYNSQRAAPVHVGLAKLETVRVDVTFMSKSGRKTQSLPKVNPADYRGKSLVIRQSN